MAARSATVADCLDEDSATEPVVAGPLGEAAICGASSSAGEFDPRFDDLKDDTPVAD
jgi:hypothetical protein